MKTRRGRFCTVVFKILRHMLAWHKKKLPVWFCSFLTLCYLFPCDRRVCSTVVYDFFFFIYFTPCFLINNISPKPTALNCRILPRLRFQSDRRRRFAVHTLLPQPRSLCARLMVGDSWSPAGRRVFCIPAEPRVVFVWARMIGRPRPLGETQKKTKKKTDRRGLPSL